jgi:quercetin dioxygenase-like cupin family protein
VADVRWDGGRAHHDQSTEEVERDNRASHGFNLRFHNAPSDHKAYKHAICHDAGQNQSCCKVEFENESVRVLRISYEPGEKSVMHYHPNAVAVCLTDGKTGFLTA